MKEEEKIRFNQKYELESYVSKLQFDSESEIDFPNYVKFKGLGLKGPKYDHLFSYTEAAKEFNILSVHILKDLLCIYLNTSKSHLDEKILHNEMAIVKEETFNGKRVATFKLNSKGMNMIKNMMFKVESAKSDTNQIPTSKTNNEFNTVRITQKETEGKISNSLINKEPIQFNGEVFINSDDVDTMQYIDYHKVKLKLDEVLPLQFMKELKYRGIINRFIKVLFDQKIKTEKIIYYRDNSMNFLEFMVNVFAWDKSYDSFYIWHKKIFLESPSYWAKFNSDSITSYWRKKFNNYIENYIPIEIDYEISDDQILSILEGGFNLRKNEFPYKDITNVNHNKWKYKFFSELDIDHINNIINNSSDVYLEALLKLELKRRTKSELPDGVDNSETVTDIDGNVYKTVQIGNQTWMAENLKVSRYRSGDLIPNVQDDEDWNNLKNDACCNYENNPDFDSEYGKLYNWLTVVDKRGLSPIGWHIPSDNEWQQLIDYLDGKDFSGGTLKETGTSHWKDSNELGTNESGFSALPGGYRLFEGTFCFLRHSGNWWSSTEFTSTSALCMSLYYGSSRTIRGKENKYCGFSVRCLRD